MGVFGGFVYGGESVGGDVYGPDVDILAAELIAADAVRVRLEAPIVVDDEYNDRDNYTITIVEGGSGTVTVRSVLPTNEDITTEVILIMDRLVGGLTYEVSLGTNLKSADGQSVVGTARFVGRKTKTENMLKGLPRHFNTSSTSTIRQILTAIGVSDDLIGGSLDEDEQG